MTGLFPNRTEFEAEADRARESARELVATSVAAEAAHDRHTASDEVGRSPRRGVAGIVESLRSRLATILGR